MKEAIVNVCKGYACMNLVSGDYCQECIELRAVHAYSHLQEGHSKPVTMCPPCEDIERGK